MTIRAHAILVSLLLSCFCPGARAEESPSPSPRDINLASVHAADCDRIRDYQGQANFMVRPGLLADKAGRVVRIAAESCIIPPGNPVEFPLVTLGSGKDYEALAVSFASAQDIHDALVFIGLTPGHGVDAETLRFWPRGDRVAMTFHGTVTGSSLTNAIPTGRLVIDTRTGKSLPENGFVFIGSEWVNATGSDTGKVYSADAFSPGAIVSLYNERASVLDVPRRASQSEVYSYQVPNPAYPLPTNALIEITFEPYFKDSRPHSSEFTLLVAPVSSSNATDLAYTLQDRQGNSANTNRTLAGLLATLDRFSGADQEAFVTFLPDEATTIASLQKLARLLDSLDTEHGIRVEAPPAGHPYFRAFLPNEKHRKRENRPTQAAELFLETTTGITTGTLVLVDSEWQGDDSTPTFHETRLPIPTPDKLVPALTSKEEAPAVVLIFVPASLKYGALRQFIAPLLQRKTILYVFNLPI
ncbi:MAG: YdjY domain-containing protein [bacterium]